VRVEAVTIPGRYCVSFKRRRSGRLRNVIVTANSVIEASREAAEWVAAHDPAGWREYGISRHKEMHYTIRSYGTNGIFDITMRGGPEHWRDEVSRRRVP
jgi:hypothetical protein